MQIFNLAFEGNIKNINYDFGIKFFINDFKQIK